METRLVIAEDDRDLRELLASFLRLAGFAVATAANGREALAEVAARRPHLVISDIRMPVCDGIELAQRLAELVPPVPLLLISGYAGSDHLGALLREPKRVRFLPKPFTVEGLIDVVQVMVAESGAGAGG
jgi:DNA-binding NtrC family response regulator